MENLPADKRQGADVLAKAQPEAIQGSTHLRYCRIASLRSQGDRFLSRRPRNLPEEIDFYPNVPNKRGKV
jgi:hypothetical protein